MRWIYSQYAWRFDDEVCAFWISWSHVMTEGTEVTRSKCRVKSWYTLNIRWCIRWYTGVWAWRKNIMRCSARVSHPKILHLQRSGLSDWRQSLLVRISRFYFLFLNFIFYIAISSYHLGFLPLPRLKTTTVSNDLLLSDYQPTIRLCLQSLSPDLGK